MQKTNLANKKKFVEPVGLLQRICSCGVWFLHGGSHVRFLTALLFLLLSPVAILTTNAAQCGSRLSDPQLFGGEIVDPRTVISPTDTTNPAPGNKRIVRGGIQYISWRWPVVELLTDGCTYIKEVKVGSLVFTRNQASTNNTFWSSALPNPADPSQMKMRVSIRLPSLSSSAIPTTEDVSIIVGRVHGPGTAAFTFKMVRVESVERINVRAPIAIAENEFYNMFSRALYTKFNGSENSTFVMTDQGLRRIYDFDPASLKVNVFRGDFEGSTGGVRFSFNFKIDVSEIGCAPTAKVDGRFHIDATISGLSIRWLSPVNAHLDWPGPCSTARLVPFLGTILDYFYRWIEDESSTSLRTSIVTLLGNSLPSPGGGTLFLDGANTESSFGGSEYLNLVIFLKIPVTSVNIKVPYKLLSGRGVAFPVGENISLVASNLARTHLGQVLNASPEQMQTVGPNGLPKYGTTISPYERALARSSAVPWPQAPIGRLLARQISSGPVATSQLFQYSPGCTFKVQGSAGPGPLQSPLGYIQFGVNEAPNNGAFEGDFYRVRLLFMNDLSMVLGDAAPRCLEAPSTPVILGR